MMMTGTICACVISAAGCPSDSFDLTGRKTPVIVSPWMRIVDYPKHHLNDFCIFRDRQGIWHCMGIMGTGTWASEQSLFHCTSSDLLGRYTIQPAILTGKPQPTGKLGENLAPQKHAPFVVEKDDRYYLFYRRPNGTNLLIESNDPFRWDGLGRVVFEADDARDVCVVKLGDEYYMYYCQHEVVDGKNRSCIMLRRSADLEQWSDAAIVYVNLMEEDKHSMLESPFLFARPEGYYLFIRNRHMDENTTTVVLFSERPDHFASGIRPSFCELNGVHAPEIMEFDGQCYIARVSGAKHANKDKNVPLVGGWIDIARMEFR